MTWGKCGSKRQQPLLRRYNIPGGSEWNRENIGKDSRYLDRYSKPVLPESEAPCPVLRRVIRATCPTHHTFLDLTTLTVHREFCKSCCSSVCDSLHLSVASLLRTNIFPQFSYRHLNKAMTANKISQKVLHFYWLVEYCQYTIFYTTHLLCGEETAQVIKNITVRQIMKFAKIPNM